METPLYRAIGKDQSANAEINFDCPGSGSTRPFFRYALPAKSRETSRRSRTGPCASWVSVPGPSSQKISGCYEPSQNIWVQNLIQLLPLFALNLQLIHKPLLLDAHHEPEPQKNEEH